MVKTLQFYNSFSIKTKSKRKVQRIVEGKNGHEVLRKIVYPSLLELGHLLTVNLFDFQPFNPISSRVVIEQVCQILLHLSKAVPKKIMSNWKLIEVRELKIFSKCGTYSNS